MSQYNLSSLADITDDRTEIATGNTGLAASLNNWFTDAEARIAALNDAALAVASSQSGASAPTNLRGQLWYDTTNDYLFLDPDGSGADDHVATRLKAYTISFATGGTATFKLGGRILTDTTQVSLGAVASGVLQTEDLPANTLNANGKYIHVVSFGTKTGTTATFTLQPRLGATALTSHISGSTAAMDWCIEAWYVRTGVGGQDAGSYLVLSRDDTGSTSLVDFAAMTKDETAILAVDINCSSKNAGDTVTGELLLVEYQG